MTKKVLLSIVILLLVGVAVVLAVYYYPATQPAGQYPVQPTKPITYTSPSTSTQGPDMDALFTEIKAASTPAAQQSVFAKVRTMASNTGVLDISNCQPKPPILQVHLRQAFTLKNTDAVERSLVHGQFTIVAPPNSEKQVTQNFPGEGVFGYQCGGKLVGILYVTQ